MINQWIVFCNSNKRVECLSGLLMKKEIDCAFIHSHIPQDKRDNSFDQFKNGKKRILIWSDLFNRGIDIPNINVVINYDLPMDTQSFVHRVGRAGRFGKKAISVSFIRD